MAIHNNQISVTYTDYELRNLVEEYITQQKSEFTLKGVCSYILYWAVEDGKVADTKVLIECNELSGTDQERIKKILVPSLLMVALRPNLAKNLLNAK